ncbi:MAG: DUF3021 domain-containing protein [Oscillospiraceae bacterium]|nr:DUF3021 domain-containing protein [Oscillospiraceae bacterium]
MKHIKDFMMRGLMASVGGPVILALVYRSLPAQTLRVQEVCLGILTSALMAFIAGGISVLYDLEKLPLLAATFLHAAVLFADYILIYLLNGWIKPAQILLFTGIFFGGYFAVWLLVWQIIRMRVKRINRRMQG